MQALNALTKIEELNSELQWSIFSESNQTPSNVKCATIGLFRILYISKTLCLFFKLVPKLAEQFLKPVLF